MVEVVWHDAHSEGVSGGTWFDPAEIKNAPYQVRSVGYLLPSVKDTHITLAQSVADTDGLCDSVLHIPVGMIIQKRVVDSDLTSTKVPQ
jgi:hypothetical protein